SDRDHPNAGYSAAMIANVVSQMENLKFTRHDESQADLFGLRFMAEAGFDPRGMAGVMRILKRITPTAGRQPEFLVTHPYPEHRLEDIQAWIDKEYPNGLPSNMTSGALLHHGLPSGNPIKAPGAERKNSSVDTW